MKYVVKRKEDGAYVSTPGSRESYTRSLEKARKWSSKAAAEAECCGNEYAVNVDHLI